jgi:hypothetical protein
MPGWPRPPRGLARFGDSTVGGKPRLNPGRSLARRKTRLSEGRLWVEAGQSIGIPHMTAYGTERSSASAREQVCSLALS